MKSEWGLDIRIGDVEAGEKFDNGFYSTYAMDVVQTYRVAITYGTETTQEEVLVFNAVRPEMVTPEIWSWHIMNDGRNPLRALIEDANKGLAASDAPPKSGWF
jgi:hypothetical protein